MYVRILDGCGDLWDETTSVQCRGGATRPGRCCCSRKLRLPPASERMRWFVPSPEPAYPLCGLLIITRFLLPTTVVEEKTLDSLEILFNPLLLWPVFSAFPLSGSRGSLGPPKSGDLLHFDSERYTMSTCRTLVRRRSFVIPASTECVGVVLSPVL